MAHSALDPVFIAGAVNSAVIHAVSSSLFSLFLFLHFFHSLMMPYDSIQDVINFFNILSTSTMIYSLY